MRLLTTVLPAALAGLASAAVVPPAVRQPAPSNDSPTTASLQERSTETCDQWGSVTTGSYIVYNNLWGESYATSGSQCTTVTGLTNDIVSWQTSWTWAGSSSNVKSYANAALSFTARTLSSISSLRAVWQYTYTGTSLVANVAFDTFLSSSCSSTGTATYEIMIWLAALGGAGPISSTGSPIATVTIANKSWYVYYGLNGSMNVYSFVATSQITSFDADITDFYDYLVNNQGLSSSSCLYTFEAGTEPFTGTSAVLKSNYYAVIS